MKSFSLISTPSIEVSRTAFVICPLVTNDNCSVIASLFSSKLACGLNDNNEDKPSEIVLLATTATSASSLTSAAWFAAIKIFLLFGKTITFSA